MYWRFHINNSNGIENNLIEFKIEEVNNKQRDECNEDNALIEKYNYDSDSEDEKSIIKENQSKEDIMSDTDKDDDENAIAQERSFHSYYMKHEEEFETDSLLSDGNEENDKNEEEKSCYADEENMHMKKNSKQTRLSVMMMMMMHVKMKMSMIS